MRAVWRPWSARRCSPRACTSAYSPLVRRPPPWSATASAQAITAAPVSRWNLLCEFTSSAASAPMPTASATFLGA